MAKKILLVEDESLTASSEAKTIEKHGYEVTLAYSGKEALERMEQENDISLVLMDIELDEEMDGTKTAQRITERYDLPIVFLTSGGEREYVEKEQQVAGYGYVLKNSGEFVLSKSIETAFSLYNAQKEAEYHLRESRNAYLEESEEKYRQLIENAPLGIFRTDSEGRAYHLNPSMARLLGASSMAEALENFYDLQTQLYVRPERRGELLQILREKGSVKNFVFEAKKLDGSHRWFEMTAHISRRFEDGSFSIDGFITDVTEQKEIERISNERRLYLEAILESTPSAVLTLDTENKIKEWNPGAERLFHYSKQEAIGEDLDVLVAGKDESIHRNAAKLTDQVSSGKPVEPTESVRYTKEGDPINIIVAGSPIFFDGKFHGIVATYTDITSLKKAQKEVKNLLDEKENLLREVHHRIKNHMNTISSILSLHSNYYDDPRISEVFEEVQSKIKVMQNIYRSLYTGENVEDVRLPAFLEELLEDLEAAYIVEKQISIRRNIEDITVSAHQSFPIGIIVNELITNSLKYAFDDQDEGTITLTIHREEEKQLSITVSDDGKGISDSVVRDKSLGFGLTLVEGYVAQFKGDISIDNTEGTTVHTTIQLEAVSK